MKKYQKGFAPILILGVVVAGVVLFLISKNFGVKNLNLVVPYTSPIAESVDTNDWKTFSNDAYEFKYPSSWKTSLPTVAYPYYVSVATSTDRLGGQGSITISADSQTEYSLPLEQWAQNNQDKIVGRRQIGSYEALIINRGANAQETEFRSYNRYILSDGEDVYIIDTNNLYANSNDDNINPAKTIDQILSTFKFIN